MKNHINTNKHVFGNIQSIILRNYNFTAYFMHDSKISSYLDLTRNSTNRKDLVKIRISNRKLKFETFKNSPQR